MTGIAEFAQAELDETTASEDAEFTDDETTSFGIADIDGDDGSDTLDLKVMKVEYTDTDSGPTVHVFGRDDSGDHHHVEVVGHSPSFFIRDEAYTDRIDNHYAVKRCETHDNGNDRYTDLHGRPLVRVYTYKPEQVANMRDLFEWTGEADVFYTKRWLIDNDIYTGIRIDTSDATYDEGWVQGEMRVDIEAVEALELDETPTPETKKVVLDIEVGGEGSVPDADRAEYPVTTIVAWDNYSETYVGWLLLADEHDEDDVLGRCESVDHLKTFHDESELLHDFNGWVSRQNPDVLTGWYSNDFDIPYLVNRSRNLNTYNFQQWSPLGDVYLSRYEPVVKGVECIDMLDGYKKTQIHKLQSKKLEDIAQKELGEGKVEHDEGYTEMWRNNPVEFLEYNKVDVELVHRIDESRGVFDLLDNLRAVAGVFASDCIGGNIDMMDTVFLRKAREYGYVLPTAVKPDVGDFRGAYVFTPKAGLHEHVVYPDYSSLYPNMMYQCNISPETLVGTAEDLAESEYDESDCVWSYIDTATPPSLKDDTDVTDEKMEKVYFLKPSVEEGFIRSVLDDIMGMCDQYSGDMYDAAKRVRNSTYGVLGDSDSYNRGFRLFDWRLAEATTLGGQKVLKGGAERFVDTAADPDAYIVGGDTDSVMTAFPNADSREDALDMAEDATADVNEWLDEFAAETFGLESEDDARMFLELESYASALFFKGDDDGKSDEGVKKRYVQQIEWSDDARSACPHRDDSKRCESCRDEDDGWLDSPDVGIKGFEYVRSDVAQVTQDMQKYTFDAILEDGAAAESDVREHVESVIEDIMTGDYPRDEFGVPFGISQPLTEYGSTDHLPLPWYKGAKFANQNIYGGDAISEGDKPLYYYVYEGKTGDSLRKTYSAHTKEDGRYVDCISVLDADDLPDDVAINREKMVEKTVIDPLKAIFRTLDWGVEWMYDAVEDAKPPEAYRAEGQTGFEMFGVGEDRSTDADLFM